MRVARKGKVSASNKIAVVCKLSRDTVKVCVVKLTAKVGRRTVAVGTGRRVNARPGVRSLGVKVKLSARGKRLLRSKGRRGLAVQVTARVQPAASSKLATTSRARLRSARRAPAVR